MTEETRIVADQENQETTAQADVTSAEASSPEAAANAIQPATAESSDAESTQAEQATSADESSDEASDNEASADERSDEASDDNMVGFGDENDESKNVVYLSVGQEVKGTIKRTTDFGAFVDIGAGRDGLIHISELAVGRINKVNDVVKQGQEVTAWIKKLDRSRNRISLTLIAPDTKTIKDLQEGEVIKGTVSKMMPYGAFIDIGVGTDALLHIREMSNGYVNKPEDVVKTGEEIDVRIITVDRRRRRIDLSLKGLRDEPEMEAPVAVQEAEPEATATDTFADVEVLSPMELAFKRAMQAEGVELDVKDNRRNKRNRKGNRSMQEEIISRTLETMRD